MIIVQVTNKVLIVFLLLPKEFFLDNDTFSISISPKTWKSYDNDNFLTFNV